ncbi:MAG: hypothetical protein V4733_03725 [Verrucomicrobiota bacterium]
MRKSIAAVICAAALPALAEPPRNNADREWELIRREAEKQGVKVDHFAKTPAEKERELFRIRQQLQQSNSPAAGKSMRSIGGAAYVPAKPDPAAKKTLAIGKLGATKR